MKHARSLLFLVITTLLVWSPGLYAQFSLGTITGRVTDSTGAVVPGCQINIQNIDTKAPTRTESNAEGGYTVPALPAGSYRVTASKPGFKEVSVEVTLRINQVLTQDIELAVGNVSQEVTVTANAAQVALGKESHELGNLVSRVEVASLPVNGRNFLGLATLAPGTQPASDWAGGTGTYFGTSNKQIIASGQGSTSSEFLQDGVDNLALFYQGVNVVPDLDAIQEFSLETNGMSAKFSQPSVVNVVGKSGSNSFHGFAYDYLQNEALDANNWLSNVHGLPKGSQRFNQFGGGIGGPIKKDKLFFFFNYEGQRNIRTSQFSGRIPTAAERQGDFSAWLTGVPTAIGTVTTQVINDPATYNPVTGTVQAFEGNIIPPDRVAGFAKQFNAFFPQPTSSVLPDGTNLHVNLRNTNTMNLYNGRGDYNISDKDRLFGTFLQANTPSLSPTFTPNIFGHVTNRFGINSALEETHIFSPTLINTAKVGYNRTIFFLNQIGNGTKDWVKEFGLHTLNPAIEQNGPPGVSVSNFFGLGDIFSPQGARQNRYQFSDELEYLRGRHRIFTGIDVSRDQFNGDWALANNGSINFNGQYTGNYLPGAAFAPGLALADYELGLPSSAIGAEGTTIAGFRATNWAGYVQDDWKLRSNLTLNLGFRYQYSAPPRDKYGHAGTYDLATATSTPGPWDSNYKNFAPRIGLAYSLNSKTVIRSGFGIYYTSTPYNVFQFALANPPNFNSQSLGFDLLHPTPVSTLFPPITPGSSILSPFALSKSEPTPYLEQWNFNVQRSLPKDILFTAAYVGNAGHHLSLRLNPNQASFDANPLQPTPLPSRRPNPQIGDVLAQYNIGNSNYNGLQLSLEKHYSAGLFLQVSYTWSHSFDLLTGDGDELINGLDPELNYSSAQTDRRHMLVFSYVYQLPFGPGKRFLNRQDPVSRYLLGGWQANGVTSYYTGLPFYITAPDFANIGFTRVATADRVCDGNLPSGQRTWYHWFNTSCFAVPPPGRLGTGGRNYLRMDGLRNWDFSLFKDTPLGSEKRTLQFRAEFFNIFNQHNFTFYEQVNVNDPSFGQAQNSQPPRVIQLALKILF